VQLAVSALGATMANCLISAFCLLERVVEFALKLEIVLESVVN
jgi:hypothetical protein